MSKIFAVTLVAATITGCGANELPPTNDVAPGESSAQAGAAAPATEALSRGTAKLEAVCPAAMLFDGKSCRFTAKRSALAAAPPSEGPNVYSEECYECTTTDLQHQYLFTSLDAARANAYPVIISSCVSVDPSVCDVPPLPHKHYDRCVGTTTCGGSSDSEYNFCFAGACFGCHQFAVCIDSNGKQQCNDTVDCGAATTCREPDHSC